VLSFFRRVPCLRQTVIVNLTDGASAIRGVLYEVKGDWLLLKQASGLQAGQKAIDMDGDVLVERTKVLFIQVLS